MIAELKMNGIDIKQRKYSKYHFNKTPTAPRLGLFYLHARFLSLSYQTFIFSSFINQIFDFLINFITQSQTINVRFLVF